MYWIGLISYFHVAINGFHFGWADIFRGNAIAMWIARVCVSAGLSDIYELPKAIPKYF